jgi:hypothetical protein
VRDPQLLRLAPAWLLVNAVLGVWLTHLGYQLSGPVVAEQALVGQFTPSRVGVVLLGYALALAMGIVGWTVVLPHMGRVRALRISLVALGSVWWSCRVERAGRMAGSGTLERCGVRWPSSDDRQRLYAGGVSILGRRGRRRTGTWCGTGYLHRLV